MPRAFASDSGSADAGARTPCPSKASPQHPPDNQVPCLRGEAAILPAGKAPNRATAPPTRRPHRGKAGRGGRSLAQQYYCQPQPPAPRPPHPLHRQEPEQTDEASKGDAEPAKAGKAAEPDPEIAAAQRTAIATGAFSIAIAVSAVWAGPAAPALFLRVSCPPPASIIG